MVYYTDTDDLHVAYLDEGAKNKPVILLLHGWPDDATTWIGIFTKLTDAGFRVIAPWLRGFGNTRFKTETTPRTGNAGVIACDMIEFMNSLAIRQFSIVGHDWGSNIAESLAVAYPDRVKRIALLSSPPRLGGMATPPFNHAQLEWYHWFMATKRGAAAVSKDPIGFAHIMWDNWAPKGWFDEQTFQEVAKSWLNADFVDVTLHSYRARWDEAEPDEKSKKLEDQVKNTKTLSLPVLYIQGEEDGVNPPYVSEGVYKKFTGPFKKVVMPGIGHFPSREAPGELAKHLMEFLGNA